MTNGSNREKPKAQSTTWPMLSDEFYAICVIHHHCAPTLALGGSPGEVAGRSGLSGTALDGLRFDALVIGGTVVSAIVSECILVNLGAALKAPGENKNQGRQRWSSGGPAGDWTANLKSRWRGRSAAVRHSEIGSRTEGEQSGQINAGQMARAANSLEHLVRVDLGRIADVGVVQQILDPEDELHRRQRTGRTGQKMQLQFSAAWTDPAHLLHCDRGLPRFLFVEDGKADGPRRVDVGMEQRGVELACVQISCCYSA
jgi:hypothetical protein